MKKFNGKQKASISVVGAIIAAALYLFGGVMGWWNTIIKADEPSPVKEEASAVVEQSQK